MTDISFLIIVYIIAMLYSTVGHGGASGYLALMSLYSFTPDVMRPAALTLNILVSLIAFINFKKSGYFRFRLCWPFAITSIPLAFLGGSININEKWYKILLGISLIIAVVRMLYIRNPKSHGTKQIKIYLALFIGAGLGLFSGLIGIGGGIILSPIIILLGWGNQKETAAVSSVFILLNSIAGLSGFLLNSAPNYNGDILYMVFAGVIGGITGSYFGSFKFQEKTLKIALSVVLLFASLKMLFLN